jgi:hypothetical protein
MAAAADYTSVVQEIYLAYFGRPADHFGLINMANDLAASGAPTNVADFKTAYATNGTVKAILDNFGASTESQTLYGTGTDSSFITAIFNNVLNRDPLQAGLDYWVAALHNHEMTRAEAAVQIIAAATKADADPTDLLTVTNKVAVATNFTAAEDTAVEINAYAGKVAAQTARDMLHSVTSATVVADFATTIQSTISQIISGSIASVNLNATTGVDTLTGGAGNDTFTASTGLSADGTTAIATTNALDKIDGGAGNDTLIIENTGGKNSVTGTITNVENVTFIGAGDINTTSDIDGSTFSGTIKFQQTDVWTVGQKVTGLTGQTIALDKVADLTIAKLAYASAQTSANVVVTGAKGSVDVEAAGAKLTTITVSSDGTPNGTLTVNDNNATADTVTTVSLAASGDTAAAITSAALTTINVTGAGAVDLTGSTAGITTLTVGDGGVTFNNTGSTVALTATTGGGADTLTVVGGKVATVSTGAGNDSVTTVTSALLATSTVDLGAGDDTLALGAAPIEGATLTGGAGTDTIALNYADYGTVAGYTTGLAKITGFENVSITGAVLADTNNVVLGKLAGVTSAQILGVADTKAATISGVGANSTIVVKGNLISGQADGSLTVTLADPSGASDVLNLTLNQNITQNNDGTVQTFTSAVAGITANGVETINFTSTGNLSQDVTGTAKTDVAVNALNLTDTAIVTLNVKGDQAFTFTSAVGSVKLATVDATANTAGGTIDVHNAATDGSAALLTVKGSSAASSVIVGSGNADTIIGGTKADTITGGAGADKLTGGGGNDTFKFAAVSDSTLIKMDTVTDFVANTFGQGANGAATAAGANAADTHLNGDMLNLNAVAGGYTSIKVSVQANSSDAQTFLQNMSADVSFVGFVGAALDSSSNQLYIDVDHNGTVDMVIKLTGVTTLTEAAFVL